MFSSNVLENILCGTSTGISTIGMLAASAFWSWMWGPVGLILATPLTVCLTVVGRYVPQLAMLNTLIGDDEVLPPGARYYQRLLADDIEEAISVADEFLTKHSLHELYDDVLVPALSLAEHDRHRGILDDQKFGFVQQTTRNYVDELKLQFAPLTAVEPTQTASQAKIMCLPAHHKADELVAIMLAHLFAREGISAEAVSIDTLSGEMISLVESQFVRIVCVSGLPPFATTHARYLCKRLRARFSNLTIAVGLWQARETSRQPGEALEVIGANHTFLTLAKTVETIKRLTSSTATQQHAA
jgi:hypothetical protein